MGGPGLEAEQPAGGATCSWQVGRRRCWRSPEEGEPSAKSNGFLEKMREQFKPSEAASNPGERGTSRLQDFRDLSVPFLHLTQQPCGQALSSRPGLPPPPRQSCLQNHLGNWFLMALLRHHLHTINFIHFKYTIHRFLVKFTESCNHHDNLILEHFHCPPNIPGCPFI